MRVIVFGATGKTGRPVVAAALGRSHEVTAFGRSVERLDLGDESLTNTGRITKINRADVAACLVDQLDDGTNSRQAISVTA